MRDPWTWLREEIPAFFSVVESENERKYLQILTSRPSLDDEQFHRQFYAQTDIPVGLVAEARSELQCLLGYDISALHPSDNIVINFDGLDFSDVLYRMEHRFNVTIPRETWL